MFVAPPASPQLMAAVERTSAELLALNALLQHEAASPQAVAAVESVGRLADAARVLAAAPLGADPLVSERLGHSTPAAAVAALAQVSDRTARARLMVAAAIAPYVSITGAPLPPALPRLAEALTAGQVGMDAAVLVTRELDSVAPRVPGETISIAEAIMVNLAKGFDATGAKPLPPVSVDRLTAEIRMVGAAIDPDGARPREERAARRRGLRIGKQDGDGLFPVSGGLLPEVGLVLQGMLEAHRRSPRFVDANAGDPASSELFDTDSRTPDQRRHDALAEILFAAAASADMPQLGGAPVSVILIAQQDEVDNEDGLDGDAVATMVGSAVPVSRARLHAFIDSSGYRVATKNRRGRLVSLTTPERCFTNAQRLAIAARDGYRCSKPSCTSPHYALQAHHVIPDRDDGPTIVDNGILLCYNCHREVDTGPWQYRMVDGVPEARGPGCPEWRPLHGATARAA